MTPNLTSINNFYYESLNYPKKEALDLTLGEKLSDAAISERGIVSLAPKKQRKLKPSEAPPLDSKDVSTTSSAKNNDDHSKKQRLFLSRKWIKSHFRMSKEATLSFYAIFMAYNQFCDEKKELPIHPMDLLNILEFEFIQDDSELHEEEKDISYIRNLKLEHSLQESEEKTLTVQQKYGDILFENLKFRCVFHNTRNEDDYASDSSDSALSSLDSDHENKEYQNDMPKNSSDIDSSYESVDESSNEETTFVNSNNLQEDALTLKRKNEINVLCISSPNHVNKGIQIKTRYGKESLNEIKIIRLTPTKDFPRIEKVLKNNEANRFAEKELKHQTKKQVLQVIPCEEIRIKREREDTQIELAKEQNESKKLKGKIFEDYPNHVASSNINPEDVAKSGSKYQKIGVTKGLDEVQWSRSQKLIIEGIAKVLSLQGFEGSPCYKDASGFAQAFIGMLQNKQLKQFLGIFAHAMTCKDTHKGLCFMFKRISHHIKSAEHKCAVKCVYAHILRLHLDSCASNNCGFRECRKFREIRQNIMFPVAAQKE